MANYILNVTVIRSHISKVDGQKVATCKDQLLDSWPTSHFSSLFCFCFPLLLLGLLLNVLLLSQVTFHDSEVGCH